MRTAKKKVARPESMGRLNEKTVFKEIRLDDPISRADIARTTGLSKPTVSRAVDSLLRQNLVFEGDILDGHREVGRKPRGLRFNPKAAVFESIDIGGTKIIFALGDLSGELTEQHSVKNPRNWDLAVRTISDYIEQNLLESSTPPNRIKGVAIAVQGVVDIERGIVTSAPNMLGPDEYPLKERLEESLSIPVLIENDGNLAAIGEFWKNKEKHQDLVYISVGTVIAGAIMINGRLYRGKNGYAGEIGWLIPDKRLLFTNHGRFGCLESVATGPALARKAKEMIQQTSSEQDSLLLNGDVSAKKIFYAYKRGSPLAKKIVDDWVEDLGIAISQVSSILDPELIILAGGLTGSADLFLNELRRTVERGTQVSPKIEISELQEKAALYGGLKLCIDYHIKQLFG